MDELHSRATSLRNQPTPAETELWNHLRASLVGHKFRRQHVIERRIGDFFCPAKALIIEVDGETHDPEVDSKRDERHRRLGYQTLRFTNAEVLGNIEGVLITIKTALDAAPDRWPHANPSPEGEGLGDGA